MEIILDGSVTKTRSVIGRKTETFLKKKKSVPVTLTMEFAINNTLERWSPGPNAMCYSAACQLLGGKSHEQKIGRFG